MDGCHVGASAPAPLPRTPRRRADDHRLHHGVVLRRRRRHAVLHGSPGRPIRSPSGSHLQPHRLRRRQHGLSVAGVGPVVRSGARRPRRLGRRHRSGVDVGGRGALFRKRARSSDLAHHRRPTSRPGPRPDRRRRGLGEQPRLGLLRGRHDQLRGGDRRLPHESRRPRLRSRRHCPNCSGTASSPAPSSPRAPAVSSSACTRPVGAC